MVKKYRWISVATGTALVAIVIVLVGCAREGTPSQPVSTIPTVLPTATIMPSPTSQPLSTVSIPPTMTEQPFTVAIPFTIIAQEAPLGDYPIAPLYTVVSRSGEWNELRDVLPARAINAGIQSGKLEDSLVVIAFAGMKGSGGHSVAVESITQQGDRIVITVSQTIPGDDDIVTDAKTLPYHLAALARENLLLQPSLTFVFYDDQGAVLAGKDVTFP